MTGISFEEVGRRVWACVLTAVNRQPATIRYQMTADWNLIRIGPDDDGWLHVSHNNIPLINIDPHPVHLPDPQVRIGQQRRNFRVGLGVVGARTLTRPPDEFTLLGCDHICDEVRRLADDCMAMNVDRQQPVAAWCAHSFLRSR